MSWQEIKDSLKDRVPENDYKLWIKPIECQEQSNEVLKLIGPDRFFCAWINDRYLPLIESRAKEFGYSSIILAPGAAPKKAKQMDLPGVRRSGSTFRSLHPGYVFDQFTTGKSNLIARSICQAIATGDTTYGNCLFINSATGLGKSHLTQAVAHSLLDKSPSSRLRYLTAQQFSAEMVRGIQARKMDTFVKKYTSCDVLLVEDVHTLTGKSKTQEELNVILDYLLKADKRVVFTSAVKPQDIKGLDDEFRSRMSAGFVAQIDRPSYNTRSNIIRQKANNHNLPLSSDHIDIIAQSLHSDVRRIENAILGIKARADLLHDPVTTDLVKKVIYDLVGDLIKINSDSILSFICDQFKVTKDDLQSRSRQQAIAFPRQVAMYLTRKHTDLSLSNIGRIYNRDHATVLYAIKAVTKGISVKTSTRRQLELLNKKFKADHRVN